MYFVLRFLFPPFVKARLGARQGGACRSPEVSGRSREGRGGFSFYPFVLSLSGDSSRRSLLSSEASAKEDGEAGSFSKVGSLSKDDACIRNDLPPLIIATASRQTSDFIGVRHLYTITSLICNYMIS